ncbi:phosphoribosylanthranilate isomerase [Halieaceae bacterium IMCC14734]|uniref:N-(5'-phosphoribosyl)anthranilate isomerase n=1 Tax=Candidatus Litorirhabdus singularis TaxID=2518993 RepID=A0ABT3TJS6_9GAMM|nr:phosphoribosylanthranilate isomerase [Candidatus Litorirhabdus singularis]MCX2981674.1 phosphoribosylanthranilate isomerase [Candidatus Litorirhabdus singularis]
MTRTRIKICGITRQVDAHAAVAAGADALGLVFYAPSPRAVDIEGARLAIAQLPPFVTLTALFVDAADAEVERVCNELPVSLLQFHGAESEARCASFGMPYIKAVRVAPDTDLEALMGAYTSAQGLLLDTYRKGVVGGTGESFDWSCIPHGHDRKLIVAGGLDADNVSEAIATSAPFAVDVSGGVEQSPGHKSREKMQAFVAAVQQADQSIWK